MKAVLPKQEPFLAKIGTSRQLAIPKKLYDDLDLSAGDYVEIVVQDHSLVLTPKVLIEKRLAKGYRDYKNQKSIGSFSNIDDTIAALEE
jgi:AbrB family looped-hinge helix DNA binding protein